MQQITVILSSADGRLIRKTLVKPEGKPAQLHVEPGTKLDVQVQGPLQDKSGKPIKADAPHDLHIKQIGQDLVISTQGEALIEVADFYATPNTTVGSVAWDYLDPLTKSEGAASVESKTAEQTASSSDEQEDDSDRYALLLPLLLGVGTLAFAGGGSSTNSNTATSAPSLPTPINNLVNGMFTAGPVVKGHNLTVQLYKADKTKLGEVVHVRDDGTFSVDVGNYTGPVLVQLMGRGGNADYRDEATDLNLDLMSDLMAMGTVGSGFSTINVNALTTMAAKVAGITSNMGRLSGIYDRDKALAANTVVAKTFGLNGDVSTFDATPVTDADGKHNPNASDAGKLLAALSGLAVINGGMANTINKYVSNTGVLAPGDLKDLLMGALFSDRALSFSGLTLLKDVAALLAKSSDYAIDAVTGDDLVDKSELAKFNSKGEATFTFKVPAGTAPGDLTLSLDGKVLSSKTCTINGTVATYVVDAANVVNLPDGPYKIQLFTKGAAVAERLFVVDRIDDAPWGISLVNQAVTLDKNTDIDSATGRTISKKVADIVVIDPDGRLATTAALTTSSFNLRSGGVFFEIKENPTTHKFELWLKDGLTPVYNSFSLFSATVQLGSSPPQTYTLQIGVDKPSITAITHSLGLLPVVSGTAEALSSVTISYGTGQLTVQADSQGNWWAQLPLSPATSTTYTLSVVQTDLAGNVSSAATSSLSIDPTRGSAPTAPGALDAPTLSAGQDTGLAGVVGSTSDSVSSVNKPELSGRGAQANASVQLFANGIQIATTTADQNGAYRFELKDYKLGLSDGVQRLTVRQVVTAGGVSVSSQDSAATMWTVDTVVNVSLASLNASSQYATDAQGVVYVNTVSPSVGGTTEAGARVEVYDNGALWQTVTADAAGRWSVMGKTLRDAATVSAHAITTVVTDVSGNVSSRSLPLNFKIHTSSTLAAPTGTLVSSDLGSSQWLKGTVTLTAGLEGPTVLVYDNGLLVGSVMADSTGKWVYNVTGLSAGLHELTVRAKDVAGNVSASVTIGSRTVDPSVLATNDPAAAPPTLQLTSDSRSSLSNATYTMLSRPKFTGSAEVGAKVEVYDGTVPLGTTTADSTGIWTLTSTVDLSVGKHSNVFAVQTDVAGNVSPGSASMAITVLPNVLVPQTYALPSDAVFSLSSADFDGDGKVDFYYSVLANQGGLTIPQGTPSTDKLMLGDGTGHFTDTPHNLPLLSLRYGSPASVLVDFNGDGRVDVVSITANADQAFYVNRGGAQSLVDVTTAAEAYRRNDNYKFISTLGDINGDGVLDMAIGIANGTDVVTGAPKVTQMVSVAPGVWRSVRELTPAWSDVASLQWTDFNNDGLLDAYVVKDFSDQHGTVWLADGKGGYKQSADIGSVFPIFVTRVAPSALPVDVNGDGIFDILTSNGFIALGRGDGSYKIAEPIILGAAIPKEAANVLGKNGSGVKRPNLLLAADVNADGWLDLVFRDDLGHLVVAQADDAQGHTYTNRAANLGWDGVMVNSEGSAALVDVNGDRSLDLIVMGPSESGSNAPCSTLVLNTTEVKEDTFLRVMVANDHGGLDAYGATVRLYDSTSGTLVAMRQVSTSSMAGYGNVGSYGADFFGLDPLKSYDVVVVYPGSDKGVTVLTGKAGLGTAEINANALHQIVDSSLTGVSPGGKDVVWVAKEDRSTSTTGGYWQGTGLADQMVGDKGNDIFKPNGARVGEAGDTLTGGGGKDRYIFDVKAVLNTGATITDFGVKSDAEADSLDMGALLTAIGYSGARTATAVANWVKVIDDGANTTIQVDAHSAANAASSGFVDMVKLINVTGKTLEQLVTGGFVHLGGLQIGNVAADQTVSETTAQAGVQLAATATLAAEGGQWAAGFQAAKLVVSLDAATAEDTLGLSSSLYDATTHAVSIGGVQVGSVDTTLNGQGAVGKLQINFDFSTAGASYATEAQQAAAVQTVMQGLKLTASGYAPTALDRAITLTVTDALGETVDVYSGIRITPEANNATVNGVKYITGTESIEALTGTSADETFIGYNGVPTVAKPVYGQGDTLTGGGGKDTFKWLSQQLMNSDANEHITDFGLKGGTGAGQGSAEADVIDLSALLKGYNNTSVVSDYIQAVNVDGKVQLQVDFDGKANAGSFEKTWFVTLDNLSVNANNEVWVNNATVGATAAGLTGNVSIHNLVQQMLADQQFKVLA